MLPKKRIFLVILILSAILVTVFHKKLFSSGDQGKSSLTLYGNIDLREVQLAFHDTGRIEKLLYLEGSSVKKGDLMATLDPIRYQDMVDADKATLDRARIQLTDAQRTYVRVKRLAHAKFNSEQKLDDATAALDAAKASIRQSEAQLALDQRQLVDTKVYAPVDGIVQNRILEPGDMAFPASPVYTIARSHPLWARVYVEEPELGKVHEGMIATVTSDSYPGRKYYGYIGYISPTSEFTPKEVQTLHQRTILVYRMRVYLSCPTTELRLGMPVTVTIPLVSDQPPPSTCPDGRKPEFSPRG
ncbi:MAG: efflux RND transporter periplasmic adaptor subunit [Leptospirillum sp.]|jgi:HlyD family secretion protein|nr:efflux RND transporter periplasmic adaptor subunit [Nitrospiraceae bacterium]